MDSYSDGAPGSCVVAAAIASEGSVGPHCGLPKAVAAGTGCTVTVHVSAGSVKTGERPVLTPVASSDVAWTGGVAATSAVGGT